VSHTDLITGRVAERETTPFALLVFFLIVVSIKPSILLRI
jgi:hypothetical protein